MFEEQVRVAKELRRDRREKGICRCGRPAREGKAACATCAAKHSAEVSKIYKAHKAAGRCHCGRVPDPGFKKCEVCRERVRRGRVARMAKGKCAHCGSRKPEPDKVACAVCLGAVRDRGFALRASYRKAVMGYYGGKCACCGEPRDEFLTIDHVNNDGKEHRKVVHASRLYRWLMKNNYPAGFQILCWNCNLAKRLHGVCPHQRAIQKEPLTSETRGEL